ncbi:CHRD domain-containing protein [Pendulispora albinea]|uniref:CHRD domain-containing protein n=1 Tax=Pendulispora albinea TaxID=2741071 RepID=A0ABZ2LY00_9BACT
MRALAFFVCTILFAGTARAAVTTYKATLDGSQPVPPNATPVTGTAVLQFDDEAKTLAGTIEYSGLSAPPAGVDLGIGACGSRGTVARPLPGPGATRTTVDTALDPAEIGALQTGNLHVSVRTAAYPDGEIRGQLYFPRTGKTCPSDAGPDAGPTADAAPPPSGGLDAGYDAAPPPGGEVGPTGDGGCSASGDEHSSRDAIAFGIVLAVASLAWRTRRHVAWRSNRDGAHSNV